MYSKAEGSVPAAPENQTQQSNGLNGEAVVSSRHRCNHNYSKVQLCGKASTVNMQHPLRMTLEGRIVSSRGPVVRG
jgi:hypothetical protein